MKNENQNPQEEPKTVIREIIKETVYIKQPDNKYDRLGCWMWGLCILIPILGLILYFIWKEEYPEKARSVVKASIIGFSINLMLIMFEC